MYVVIPGVVKVYVNCAPGPVKYPLSKFSTPPVDLRLWVPFPHVQVTESPTSIVIC